MSSSASRLGGMRAAWSSRSTSSRSSGRTWRGETFTERRGASSPASCQPAQRLASLADHPAPDRSIEPDLLGEADELERRHQPERGVLPADERLRAERLARPRVDDRLVVEPELAALDRAREIVSSRMRFSSASFIAPA